MGLRPTLPPPAPQPDRGGLRGAGRGVGPAHAHITARPETPGPYPRREGRPERRHPLRGQPDHIVVAVRPRRGRPARPGLPRSPQFHGSGRPPGRARRSVASTCHHPKGDCLLHAELLRPPQKLVFLPLDIGAGSSPPAMRPSSEPVPTSGLRRRSQTPGPFPYRNGEKMTRQPSHTTCQIRKGRRSPDATPEPAAEQLPAGPVLRQSTRRRSGALSRLRWSVPGRRGTAPLPLSARQ
jgi:hypothetical protein